MSRSNEPASPRARPLVSVDVAIFSVRDERLQVLLVRRGARTGASGSSGEPRESFPGRWALPGGFVDVKADASLADCARRKLHEKTGVSSPYLEQLGSWGDAKRDPRGWSTTHVYFALVPAPEPLAAGGNASDAAWWPVEDAEGEPLAFDHAELLAAALARLRSKVEYTSLPAQFLPEEFTLSDLQRAFEVVLGRPVEKSAFRTRVLAADFLVEVPRRREGANRPAQLYRQKNPGEIVFFPRTFSPRRG